MILFLRLVQLVLLSLQATALMVVDQGLVRRFDYLRIYISHSLLYLAILRNFLLCLVKCYIATLCIRLLAILLKITIVIVMILLKLVIILEQNYGFSFLLVR